MIPTKPHISIAIIGPLDCGKSTSLGHLFYKNGTIKMSTFENIEKKAAAMGKASLKYAWLVDKSKGDHQRYDANNLSTFKLETKTHQITVIDTPGHRDFIENMVTAISQVDCILLLVSAKQDEFEAGMNINGQIREQALLALYCWC